MTIPVMRRRNKSFSGIQAITLGFIMFLPEVVADGSVGRVLYFDDETGGVSNFTGGKARISPVHKCLRNKNCIQTVGETGNLPFELFHTSVATQCDVHLYHANKPFREFRKTSALCKAEIIEIQVIARNDNRDNSGLFVKKPFIEVDIYVFIGYRLKNISVERCIPAFCMPNPADTLNKEGVKTPTFSVKGCSFISSISFGEKVLLFPVRLPRVLIFW